jgi:hypothetical protein
VVSLTCSSESNRNYITTHKLPSRVQQSSVQNIILRDEKSLLDQNHIFRPLKSHHEDKMLAIELKKYIYIGLASFRRIQFYEEAIINSFYVLLQVV